MIGRNHLVEIKRIKELTLSFFPSPHHALLPPMPSPPTESWFAIRIKGSFATQSRGERTCRTSSATSGFDPVLADLAAHFRVLPDPKRLCLTAKKVHRCREDDRWNDADSSRF